MWMIVKWTNGQTEIDGPYPSEDDARTAILDNFDAEWDYGIFPIQMTFVKHHEVQQAA